MTSIDAVRPSWWRYAVGITDVVIPLVGTLGLFVDPLGFAFDNQDVFAGNKQLELLAKDNLRGEACGNVVAIVLATLTISTKSVEALREYSSILLVYLGLLFSYMLLMWIMSGFSYLDTFGFTMNTIMLCLQLYIQYRIKSVRSTANGYTTVENEAAETS